MLREFRVSELRYRAVLEVLDGASVTEVARRFGVSRQTVHVWLRRYAGEGGLVNLEDRSSRPHGCPHQLAVAVEARLLEVRDVHPTWGADRIRYQLERDGVVVPSRSAVYRALVRNGRIDPTKRKRRRADYRRWQRGRPMELWQMDVVGAIHLADRVEVKCVTGIDDNSRFVVSAMLMPRATARPVCDALLAALRRHGIPEQILTDNGKVFTGRFGPRGSTAEVLFDRICVENGIKHLLTAPRSPTTTGKVERFHRAIRTEFRTDRVFASLPTAQGELDEWVDDYNTRRPHQALDMAVPADRFHRSQPAPVTTLRLAPASGRPATGRGDGTWVARRASAVGAVCVNWQQVCLGQAAAGRNIDVWVTDQVLQCYDGDQLLRTEKRTNRREVKKKRASVPGGRTIVKNDCHRSTELDLSPITRSLQPTKCP
jgi:transposase InsO family protein